MSNAVDGLFGSRVERSAGTVGLAVGDLLVLAGFLTLGSINHGVDPVTMLGRVAGTIAPFLAGWVVGALAVGAYAPGTGRRVRTSVVRVVGAWVVAAAIGLALRSTAYFHGSAPWTFALVVTTVGAVSFAVWRAAAASLR
jgi:hypothetical protein